MSPVTAALSKMRGAGFSVQAVDGRLRVSPADRLSATQRQWIAANRDALLLALVQVDPAIAEMQTVFDAVVVRVVPDPTAPPPVSVELPESTDTGGCSAVWELPVMAGTLRCTDCQHGSRSLPGDELGAWRHCEAGKGGRFALARHRCQTFKAALAENMAVKAAEKRRDTRIEAVCYS